MALSRSIEPPSPALARVVDQAFEERRAAAVAVTGTSR
jgi:hypothetical protein